MPLTCDARTDVGQFGTYAGPFKLIRLPSGDTLTVYRVKYWTFTDSSAPALQLEYQTQVVISDVEAVRAEQRKLWPVFESYVDRLDLSTAILTATDRNRRGSGVAHVTTMRHYGTIAVRDSIGIWRFQGDSVPLPPAVAFQGVGGKGVGIFERSGAPLDIGTPR
jgi:hypothetical protein